MNSGKEMNREPKLAKRSNNREHEIAYGRRLLGLRNFHSTQCGAVMDSARTDRNVCR